MAARELLAVAREVRELLANEECWTQGAMARKGNGDEVDALDLSACRWCLAGRFLYSARRLGIDHAKLSMELKLPLEYWKHWSMREMINVNDSSTHAEMLAFLDERIAELETLVVGEVQQ